jgi:SAM-dependent methyltransferase
MTDESEQSLEGRVKAQYESFPYPDIPQGKAGEIALATMPSDLLAINHYIFAGRRNFSKPFRVLVAGGGTGVATVRLAQQLQQSGCPSEVFYLDVSTASREVAEQRAKTYRLDNIVFHTGSLLELPAMDCGEFDYIDCGGVLHHLTDPNNGLQILRDVLVPLGGIGLMLYAPFGRAGIYPIQEIMRRLGVDAQIEKLPLLKRVLDALPSTNLLWHHERFRNGYGDNDAELVDLFLHPVDRPFTVPELSAMCVGAGLRIVRFLPTAKYEPSTYLGDEEIKGRAEEMEWIDRAALAELLAGNIHMHSFFAVRDDNLNETKIDIGMPDLPDFVPVLRDTTGAALAVKLGEAKTFSHGFDGTNLVATITPAMWDIIAEIDGARTLEEIYLALSAKKTGLDWRAFRMEYTAVHQILHDVLYGLFLRR